MTIKELEKSLDDNDMLVEIQYIKKNIYELRNSDNIKKYYINSTQFKKLKEKFNFKHFKCESSGFTTHYYKRSYVINSKNPVEFILSDAIKESYDKIKDNLEPPL